MKKIIKIALALFFVCFIAVGALATVEYITRDAIKENQIKEINSALTVLIPDCEYVDVTTELQENVADFNENSSSTVINQIFEAVDVDGNVVGHVVVLDTKGYVDIIGLRVGILSDGTVSGVVIGTNSETPGLGANISKSDFLDQFKEQTFPFEVGSNIDKITSATYSSKYVVDGINNACEFISNLEG